MHPVLFWMINFALFLQSLDKENRIHAVLFVLLGSSRCTDFFVLDHASASIKALFCKFNLRNILSFFYKTYQDFQKLSA